MLMHVAYNKQAAYASGTGHNLIGGKICQPTRLGSWHMVYMVLLSTLMPGVGYACKQSQLGESIYLQDVTFNSNSTSALPLRHNTSVHIRASCCYHWNA